MIPTPKLSPTLQVSHPSLLTLYQGVYVHSYPPLHYAPAFFRQWEVVDMLLEMPVILEIELQNECDILADENFVDLRELKYGNELETKLELEKGRSWSEYGSCIIWQDIPYDWVRRIHFPYDEFVTNPEKAEEITKKIVKTKAQNHFVVPLQESGVHDLPPMGSIASAEDIYFEFNEDKECVESRLEACIALSDPEPLLQQLPQLESLWADLWLEQCLDASEIWQQNVHRQAQFYVGSGFGCPCCEPGGFSMTTSSMGGSEGGFSMTTR